MSNDHNIEGCLELWKLGIGRTFWRHLLWAHHVKGLLVWYDGWKGFCYFAWHLYEICPCRVCKCITWLTNQGKDTKSGQRCGLMWVYIKENQALMWRQGEILHSTKFHGSCLHEFGMWFNV